LSKILDDLNEMQRSAVTHLGGPLLILAGAGSGKTRVITRRIVYLLEQGITDPQNIFAVTFTNKASREMKERVNKLLKDISIPWLGTFHSMSARILRREISVLGRPPDFSIMNRGEQMALIRECMKEVGVDDKANPPRKILSSIGIAKIQLKNANEFAATAHGAYPKIVAEIFRRYEEKLKLHNGLDFNDLITQTVRLFIKHPDILENYRDRFHHIMVDEYQDVNYAQYMLTRLLADESGNICVVGDDDQSIYGFRGADVSIILRFEKDFKDARIIKLEENYRSTGVILEAANNVVKKNRHRKEKKLWTQKEYGEKITIRAKLDSRSEATFVVEEIKRRVPKNFRYGDIAVLYRTNSQSRAFEEVMSQEGIDYEIVGGLRFYERAEIKDAIAYLKLIVNPRDYINFRRIINNPARGIGNVTRNKIISESVKKDIDLLEVMKNASNLPRVGKKIQETLSDFAETVELLSDERLKMSSSDFINLVLDEVEYWNMLKSSNLAENQDRLSNLEELINRAKEFELFNEDKTVEAFLEKIALFTDIDEKRDSPLLDINDILDWRSITDGLKKGETPDKQRVYALLDAGCKKIIDKSKPGKVIKEQARLKLLEGLNNIIKNREFYSSDDFKKIKFNKEEKERLKKQKDNTDVDEIAKINRMLIETIYPHDIASMDKVVFMTLHSAKGLEFPVVFIVGLEEGLLPHVRSIIGGKESALEEERRLFYVGITRATKKLYITYSRERIIHGKSHNQSPSRFLREIPEDLVDSYVPEVAHRRFTRKVALVLNRHQVQTEIKGYKPGDLVYHKIFGKGKVISFKKGYVTAEFPGTGKKTLASNFLSPYGSKSVEFKPGDKVKIKDGNEGIIKELDGDYAYIILEGPTVEKVALSSLSS